MDLDLDHMLNQVRKGQWSIDEFDWSTPLAGAENLTRRDRKEAGIALLFTAGLERQAARIFRLAAHFSDDPRAREIYRLFHDDERRHAEAEIRLARRYGAEWDDLPKAARAVFKQTARELDRNDRGVHEFSAATIVLFELALDGVLIPTLKEMATDPLQDAVFRRIDQDEARHLAMDYWLLDAKGRFFRERGLERGIEEMFGRQTLGRRLTGRLQLATSLAGLLLAFGSMKLVIGRLHRKLTEPQTIRRYRQRVDAVPRKAPAALSHPVYRSGLAGQRYILSAILATAGRSPRAHAQA
jgi:hypothetical protein